MRLGTWPTPLEPAPRLAAALGLGPDDLWVKRDDLTGLGGGGNKVRKLEWTCAAALAAGARTLVTSGAPQSNHARLTAAAGARLGLDVVLVLAGSPAEGDAGAIGNLALDGLLGATLVWAGDGPAHGAGLTAADRLAAVVRDTAVRLDQLGRAPAVIPFGGSSVLGARGYLEGGRELAEQARERALDLATVVTAVGSGGTMAGLVGALGAERVLGVDVGAVADPVTVVAELVAGLSSTEPDPAALRLRLDQVGAGYGVLTDPVLAAMSLAARTEGLVLDPVYTGRALAGLAAAAAAGDVRPGQGTVLLHSGGLPGLFGHPDALARAYAAHRVMPPSGPTAGWPIAPR